MLVAIEGDSNPYLKHKRFHEIPFPSQSDKLFQYQEEILNWSSMTVELLVHKYDGVARSTSKLLSQQKSATLSRNINSQSIFNVAAHTRNEGGRTAIKQVVSSLEKHPYIVGFVLLAVQLFVSEGNISSAVSILELFMKRLEQSISESDQEIRYNPGLVSVLISLYRLQGRKWQINAEFAKAATFWRQRPQQEQPLSLLRAAASSLLQSQDPSDIRFASEIFDALHTADPTDGIASIGHVACHGATSTLQAKDKVSTLSPVQDLISDVDVASLEAAGIPSMPTTTISASRKRKAGEEKDKTGLQKKRVRKSHLPKDYDPNKKPDPERWLPLRDRSTYRPKGKKGKQKAADRTQGGVVSEKAADSAPSAGVVQQKSGGNSKKKKSKGKR